MRIEDAPRTELQRSYCVIPSGARHRQQQQQPDGAHSEYSWGIAMRTRGVFTTGQNVHAHRARAHANAFPTHAFCIYFVCLCAACERVFVLGSGLRVCFPSVRRWLLFFLIYTIYFDNNLSYVCVRRLGGAECCEEFQNEKQFTLRSAACTPPHDTLTLAHSGSLSLSLSVSSSVSPGTNMDTCAESDAMREPFAL